MKLWTFKPPSIVQFIVEDKMDYICNPTYSYVDINDNKSHDTIAYNWLKDQMIDRLGMSPIGVVYPVWAWYRSDGEYNLPSNRDEWYKSPYYNNLKLLELEVPDNKVLLSDFNLWNDNILHNTYCPTVRNENDYKNEYNKYWYEYSPAEQDNYMYKSWEIIFDVKKMEEYNQWEKDVLHKGFNIQATFWILKPEYIVGVI